MRFGWFVVGALAGMFGGAVANEWKHTSCSCHPRGALTGPNGARVASQLEQDARDAMQFAQQWGMDALSSAQIQAIDAWDQLQAELSGEKAAAEQTYQLASK
mgnify:FL=1